MTTELERRKAQMAAAAARRTEPDARQAGQTAVRSKPVRVTLGITNGTVSEVTAGDLHEGDTVAIGSTQSNAKPTAPAGTPFGMGGARRGGSR